MNIREIQHIIRAIREYCHGDGLLGEISNALQESPDKIELLFYHNNIIASDGKFCGGVEEQDVINIVLFYYALKASKKFEVTVVH